MPGFAEAVILRDQDEAAMCRNSKRMVQGNFAKHVKVLQNHERPLNPLRMLEVLKCIVHGRHKGIVKLQRLMHVNVTVPLRLACQRLLFRGVWIGLQNCLAGLRDVALIGFPAWLSEDVSNEMCFLKSSQLSHQDVLQKCV